MEVRKSASQALFLIGACGGILVLCSGAEAQPSYPLYCRGPLTTQDPAHPGKLQGPTTTKFTWAVAGAGKSPPGAGECAWADRAPRGSEIQAGHGNVLCDVDYSDTTIQNLPANQFWEVGVYRDETAHNCLRVTQYVGIVTPPFSANPVLPPQPAPPPPPK